MKKNYKSIFANAVLALALVGTAKLAAQPLSGVYTLDNTQPSSATNFTSFTQFAASVNANGVAGPVRVDVGVTSGPYNEQVTFNQATGISATNSITVNGNGRVISFNSVNAAAPHTILLNGADYMFFHNLEVIGTGPTYALSVHLYNQANYNQFLGCRISAPLNGTGTSQVPFSLSGTATSPTSAGDCGNFNIVNTCTISGGYYNTVFYGNSGTPKNLGNEVRNSYMVDFYVYGMYNVYCENSLIKGNVVERLNRTTLSTGYGIFLNTGSLGNIVEGNHIRKLFNMSPTNTNLGVGVYVQFSSIPNREAIIRNNIVSDIISNGTVYGVYVPGYSNIWVLHNTVVVDNPTTSATTVYGIYNSLAPGRVENNLVSITRTGTGTKVCLYIGAATTMTVDGNMSHITSPGGIIGYINANFTTFSAWQAANNAKFDQHGSSADPIFANILMMDYTPTNVSINNMGIPAGVVDDYYTSGRSMTTPDPGAIEFFNTSCGGTPLANAVALPQTEVCAGMPLNALLPVSIYTNSGFTFQWQASLFSIGGFTNIPGANVPYMTFAPSEDTYYSVVITCTNGGGSVTATPALFNVAPTTTNTVPYYEGFESLGANNLPNCSWSSSSMAAGKAVGTTITYTSSKTNGRFPRTGTNFASFVNSPAGANYYYTNGIELKAGITYSASLWYVTEFNGFLNWTDLSILVGQSQSPTGLQSIVSSNGPATSNIYKNLSNTFQVNADGIYYVAVRATAQASGAQFLSWDDLSITIPCEVNAPSLKMVTTNSIACAGFPVHMVANGAASYTWNTGANTPNITAIAPEVLAPTNIPYVVTGSDLLSGCTSQLTQNILVNPSPQVLAVASDPMICDGEQVTLSAINAAQYAWAHGPSSPITTVKPNTTTTYSVNGTNSYGCYRTATVQVVVNAKPVVGAQASPVNICQGDQTILTANGASTYTWVGTNSGMHVGNPVAVSPASATYYQVTGMDANGCTNSYQVVVTVDVCAGIAKNSAVHVSVYPNPATEMVTVESAEALSYELLDVLGKVIAKGGLQQGKATINISSYPAGLYHLRLNGDHSVHVTNIVVH